MDSENHGLGMADQQDTEEKELCWLSPGGPPASPEVLWVWSACRTRLPSAKPVLQSATPQVGQETPQVWVCNSGIRTGPQTQGCQSMHITIVLVVGWLGLCLIRVTRR